MPVLRSGSARVVFFGIALASATSAHAQVDCGEWAKGVFPISGPNDTVWTIRSIRDRFGEALYFGGEFEYIVSTRARRIARFDGREWLPLGSGLENSDGSYVLVESIAAFDDGTGLSVYAGGRFDRAGGVAVSNIARFDGREWSPVGSGLDGRVRDLLVFDDGAGPALYASGSFRTAGAVNARSVARWDGAAWSSLGGGLNGVVNGLGVFDDGSGPALYATGGFRDSATVPIERVARFDGAAWRPLGGGLDGEGEELIAYEDRTGRSLYVVGKFNTAGGIPAAGIARWDGTSWHRVGSGEIRSAESAVVADFGSGSELYVGAEYQLAGGPVRWGVARWNGSSWSAAGTDIYGPPRDLAAFDAGGGVELFASTTALLDSARFDGAVWRTLADPTPGPIFTLYVVDAPSGPKLVASGSFTLPIPGGSASIAMWNGSRWTAMGGARSSANDFVTFDDGSGPALYAAGVEGSSRVSYGLYRWDGASWTSIPTDADGAINSLAVFDDGTGPAIFAGGDFSRAGGQPARRVAKWDGTRWWGVGGGVNETVSVLEALDDGTGPALYAGGRFTEAGGAFASRVAKWDGARWTAVADELFGTVEALAIAYVGPTPALVAGGSLFLPSEGRFEGVVYRDATIWRTLSNGSSGVYGIVSDLATVDSGRVLFAGGSFSAVAGRPGQMVARWDGAEWTVPGGVAAPGSSDRVLALATARTGNTDRLFAGGYFFTMADVVSTSVARWDEPPLSFRAGSVNAGLGVVADVLFVNDSPGDAERRLSLGPSDRLEAFVDAPLAATGPSPFVMYLWGVEPGRKTARRLGGGIGITCLPTPLSSGDPQPIEIWNNTTRSRLGIATRASSAAPSRLFRLPSGTGRPITFFLQGVIADPGSASARRASVTNGVLVEVR